MMTNLFPMRVISYYASTKSPIDGKHSYNYWMRSKLVRIIADKPFARGDVLVINSLKSTNMGMDINCIVEESWAEEYPVLCLVSGRLIYNKWSDFEFKSTEGVQILSPIEQVLSDNYSFGLVLAVYKSGKVICADRKNRNRTDIAINLDWE